MSSLEVKLQWQHLRQHRKYSSSTGCERKCNRDVTGPCLLYKFCETALSLFDIFWSHIRRVFDLLILFQLLQLTLS
jgi:hypothetical protein